MSCGNHHDTDCSEVLDRVYEYLDNEMGELDCAKIKQHLEECGPCLAEYDLDGWLAPDMIAPDDINLITRRG